MSLVVWGFYFKGELPKISLLLLHPVLSVGLHVQVCVCVCVCVCFPMAFLLMVPPPVLKQILSYHVMFDVGVVWVEPVYTSMTLCIGVLTTLFLTLED